MKRIFMFLLCSGLLLAQNKFDAKVFNSLYYNLNDYGFRGFTGRLEIDDMQGLLNAFPTVEAKEALKSVNIRVGFWGVDSIVVEDLGFSPTSNDRSNAAVSKMIEGMKTSTEGFFENWSCFVFGFNIAEEVDSSAITSSKEITMVDMSDSTGETKLFISKDNTIDSIKETYSWAKATLIPHFSVLPNGKRLINIVESYFDTGLYVKMEVSYIEIKGMEIPSSFTGSIKNFMMEAKMKFNIKDITLVE